MTETTSLSSSLHNVLTDLYQNPYPHVPNPPLCKKRASVALILRVRPTYNHWPNTPSPPSRTDGSSVKEQLDTFFLRIGFNMVTQKFCSSSGHRVWEIVGRAMSHFLGKRDPEDVDDKAAAVREAWEEIGLDLTTDDCIHVGNLPERVVTMSWGTVPYVICNTNARESTC